MLRYKIEKILKEKKLSLTKSRKKVLKFFIKSSKPLSLNQIRLFVGKMDRVTLFRVLNIFESKQIVHKIRLENGKTLYALCKEECEGDNHNHNHIHFQCENCNDVSCLTIENFPVLKIPNYTLNNIDINVTGLCINCN
ncbi:MAG: transcriptional repressor [Flavobacteriales bacterium]|jgi:Fur family ferric uptake transcriptional regulator|nr:transcriptional repressor [Flavobacteriales bacterium]|tara:strand:+ start:29863 stop:30276 length:414 start_codon:yes stop_codon:yes gene_type:complete